MHETAPPDDAARAPLAIRHDRETGTLMDGIHREDRRVLSPIFTRYRVRWSDLISEEGSWYLRGSRGRAADTFRINELAGALRAAGFPVTVSIDDTPITDIATWEAARIGRAEDRATHHTDAAGRATARADARRNAADALRGAIPLGQPVLAPSPLRARPPARSGARRPARRRRHGCHRHRRLPHG